MPPWPLPCVPGAVAAFAPSVHVTAEKALWHTFLQAAGRKAFATKMISSRFLHFQVLLCLFSFVPRLQI